MKIRRLLLISILILVIGLEHFAQDPDSEIHQVNEFGFEKEKWHQIEERWMQSQPVVAAFTGQEEYAAGQFIHINFGVSIFF